MGPTRLAALYIVLLPAAFGNVAAAQSHSSSSKRGFGFTADSQRSDVDLLLSGKSPIDWYYSWSLYPASVVNNTIPFVPLIHGLDDASQSELGSLLDALPSSSTHLLSFNEPDGTTDSGGSSISAQDAAKAYIDHIAPLRTAKRSWNISHPATTGSGRGLDWLREFNESCYDIDKKHGCPADFVSVHWYGDYTGLTSWLETLRRFYGNASSTADLKFWITEFALPQGDGDATVSMMNQSLAELDKLDFVEEYAWFGTFRSDKANSFVGGNVALFDNSGGLTELGAEYLGGAANGFQKGMGGSGASQRYPPARAAALIGLVVMLCMW